MEPKISAAEKEPILNRLMEMLYPGALDAYSKRQLKQHDNFRAETAQYQQALRDGPMMDAPLPGANPEVPDLRTGMTGVLTGALGVPGAASKPFENVLRMEQPKAPPQSRTKASRIENIKFHAEDARTRATEAELAGDAPQAAYWKDMYQRRLIDVNKVVNAKPEPPAPQVRPGARKLEFPTGGKSLGTVPVKGQKRGVFGNTRQERADTTRRAISHLQEIGEPVPKWMFESLTRMEGKLREEPQSNLSAMLKIAQKNMRENPMEPAKNQAQVDAAHERLLKD